MERRCPLVPSWAASVCLLESRRSAPKWSIANRKAGFAQESRYQPRIQLIQQRCQPVPEQLVCLAQPAALREGCFIEVILVNGQARANMFGHCLQPQALLIRECPAQSFLLCQPNSEPLLHGIGERLKRALPIYGVPDQGYEVRENAAAGAADLGAVQRLVSVPEGFGRPGGMRLPDRLGQIPNLAVRESLLVGAAVEHLKQIGRAHV